ncbi:MAG: hypothetical protein PHS79_00840 [Patescibacteria group bacterium]|nr:hypothetical protein [Patescibacteria group bacterium]
MRLIKRKGPFKMIEMLLEELTVQEVAELKRQYQRISVLTHRSMDLPGFRLRQKKTPNIYVDLPLDEVFGRFRDTVRNEIRRTERMEGFAVKLPDYDYERAYSLYCDFEFSQSRAPISIDDFKEYQLACAYLNGRLLSVVSFYQSGDKIRVRSIFSSRLAVKDDPELYKAIGFATKRLIYEICKYAQSSGAKLVDLASINLTDPAKEPIARFKSGFGAKIEDEYQYIYVSNIMRWAEYFAGLRAKLKVTLHGKNKK